MARALLAELAQLPHGRDGGLFLGAQEVGRQVTLQEAPGPQHALSVADESLNVRKAWHISG
jgi:hypothetical protein